MKILQVTNFFKPSWEAGGIARVAYEISKELVNRGHEVTVYTTDGFKYRLNVKKNTPINVDGIKVYYFRNLSNYLSRKLVITTPYYLPIIAKKEIRNFDIIHIHEHRSFLSLLVAYYAKLYKVPYVIHGHGTIDDAGHHPLLKKIWDILFGRCILNNAAYCIAVSKLEYGAYVKRGITPRKIKIVYNFLNFEYIFSFLDYNNNRKSNTKQKNHYILYLGRIHKLKGLDFLVKAFSKIKYDANLIIAGKDDGFLKDLQSMISQLNLYNRVKIISEVPEKMKFELYKNAKIFATVARYMGGVALTPLEAIICGTPSIVSKEAGEIIEKIDKNFVVQYGDLTTLKYTIEYLLENPKERKKIVVKGKNYIVKNFHKRHIMQEILNIYKKAIIKNTTNSHKI
ncbi:MAG: glycosyltransferase [Candidatus Marinimicrobia bacterium]|nr:glycosyltransferase [Candidatus Neomarinimicrobiota bacterium]